MRGPPQVHGRKPYHTHAAVHYTRMRNEAAASGSIFSEYSQKRIAELRKEYFTEPTTPTVTYEWVTVRKSPAEIRREQDKIRSECLEILKPICSDKEIEDYSRINFDDIKNFGERVCKRHKMFKKSYKYTTLAEKEKYVFYPLDNLSELEVIVRNIKKKRKMTIPKMILLLRYAYSGWKARRFEEKGHKIIKKDKDKSILFFEKSNKYNNNCEKYISRLSKKTDDPEYNAIMKITKGDVFISLANIVYAKAEWEPSTDKKIEFYREAARYYLNAGNVHDEAIKIYEETKSLEPQLLCIGSQKQSLSFYFNREARALAIEGKINDSLESFNRSTALSEETIEMFDTFSKLAEETDCVESEKQKMYDLIDENERYKRDLLNEFETDIKWE